MPGYPDQKIVGRLHPKSTATDRQELGTLVSWRGLARLCHPSNAIKIYKHKVDVR
jgi:hypothetical protein